MRAWRRLVIFSLGLLPLVSLLFSAANDALGPDLGKALIASLGFWALIFLLITLSLSSIKRRAGVTTLMAYRRMLGLFCWFYATLHLLSVLTYMLGWDWQIFKEEFSERPYMALGIIAWCLLVPLGITSNQWSMRKMGRSWRRLHQLIYLVAVLSVLHVVWQVRSDYIEALLFTAVLLVLMADRIQSKAFNAAKRS